MHPFLKITREICRPFKNLYFRIEGDGFLFEPTVPLAIKVTGGLGDHVIAARYIRDLVEYCGDLNFDLYSSRPEIASWVFRNQPGINEIYNEELSWGGYRKKYALALFVSQFVVIDGKNPVWWKFNKNKKLTAVCFNIKQWRRKFDKYIGFHPHFDGFMAQEIVYYGMNRYTIASNFSGVRYGGDTLELNDDKNVLDLLRIKAGEYITVGGGYDAFFERDIRPDANKKSTKAYPYFNEVIKKIRDTYPELEIIQLGGSSTTQKFNFATLDLRDKTTFDELTAILKGSLLHLDNEGGLVHVAACVGTTSCVVFGPTPSSFFGYKNNINISPNRCGGCWWVNDTWMSKCPKGMLEPECIYTQPYEHVAALAIKFIENKTKFMKFNNKSHDLTNIINIENINATKSFK